ncbi:uncharacterized protein LOC132744382 [Ruditapes philippinarum]|uniref:uncharacterized protein LOC132744382 n=1 Tax=Ruditapes philippinarum TaxID=129788 RepID=UPI00295BF786|nr:uncharacterized protein LOC132744382 [Ruditapes philippinarum]
MVLVFRYGCGTTKGPACFTDCADHMMNESCPLTTPKPPDVITFTGFTERRCQTVDANGTSISLNCTTGTSAALPSTTENETTEVTITATLPTTTTKPTTTTTTATETTTSTATTTTQESTSESLSTSQTVSSNVISTIIDTHLTKSTKIQSTKPHVRNTVPESTKNHSSGLKNDSVTPPTTPSEGVSSVAVDPAAYWPGIVGGVLGGVAVFAAAGFICYWNRQKKLQKRQEIYNVNPKILRNFEEFEENGTSGRADVPMETEQY